MASNKDQSWEGFCLAPIFLLSFLFSLPSLLSIAFFFTTLCCQRYYANKVYRNIRWNIRAIIQTNADILTRLPTM